MKDVNLENVNRLRDLMQLYIQSFSFLVTQMCSILTCSLYIGVLLKYLKFHARIPIDHIEAVEIFKYHRRNYI